MTRTSRPGKSDLGSPIELEVEGRNVRLSSPDRVYFSERGETKLDLARYYQSVGPGIVNALRERPCMLHRFPDGVEGPKVHQKRLPRGAPVGGRTRNFPTNGASTSTPCRKPRLRASGKRPR